MERRRARGKAKWGCQLGQLLRKARAARSLLLNPTKSVRLLSPPPCLSQGPSEDETVDITAKAAIGFVFLASGMLLFIFFLFNQFFFYVLLVFFCVAAAQVWAWIRHDLDQDLTIWLKSCHSRVVVFCSRNGHIGTVLGARPLLANLKPVHP